MNFYYDPILGLKYTQKTITVLNRKDLDKIEVNTFIKEWLKQYSTNCFIETECNKIPYLEKITQYFII